MTLLYYGSGIFVGDIDRPNAKALEDVTLRNVEFPSRNGRVVLVVFTSLFNLVVVGCSIVTFDTGIWFVEPNLAIQDVTIQDCVFDTPGFGVLHNSDGDASWVGATITGNFFRAARNAGLLIQELQNAVMEHV